MNAVYIMQDKNIHLAKSIDFNDPFWQHKIILIDSRNLLFPDKSIFIAFEGRFSDGHQFIDDLYHQGVRHFIISKSISYDAYPNAHFIRVKNAVTILQDFARHHRQQFNLPIIAITGSNGKTILKEWLYLLLQQDFSLIKSPKSYNSQIGVPLSVLNINAKHNLGIFETGISQAGEMEKLAAILRPDIGIFTNIGKAHDSGFASRNAKIKEKLRLFKHCKIIIYRIDHQQIHEEIRRQKLDNCYAWGTSLQADMPVYFKSKKKSTTLFIHYRNKQFKVKIPFKNAAAIENCAHAVCTLLFLGIKPKRIEQYLPLLRDVPMRLELKEGINDCQIIDDSYNNDLQGLQIALDFLAQKQVDRTEKTLILSDLPEAKNETDYRAVASVLQEHKIQRLVGIGPYLKRYQGLFGTINQTSFYTNTAEFVLQIGQKEPFNRAAILVKGARSFGFEKIAQHLKKRIHASVLEINMEALKNNLEVCKNSLLAGTKIMVMVKAAAYGSGSTEVAQLLQYKHVDYLGVAYVDEGVRLRQQGIHLPIMVMNTGSHEFDILVQEKLEPAIFSLDLLLKFIDFLDHKMLQKPYPIHIEIDSGMHRLGFEPKTEAVLLKLLKKHKKQLQVKGIFSHLAVADDTTRDDFSHQQANVFDNFARAIEKTLKYTCIKHLLNSAGIQHLREYQYDMVRLGIGIYGFDMHHQLHKLENVLNFKSSISQIKELKKGSSLGYGGQTVLQEDKRIAVVALGYADGFLRIYGNGNSKLYVANQAANTIGQVCMDMCFIDVTEVEAEVGDEVIIFDSINKINALAKAAHTIPYEILTNISERVPRIFYEG